MFKAKKAGDWDKFDKLFTNLGSNITTGTGRAGERSAKKVLKKLKDHIEAQDLDWAPLNPDYLKQKTEQGFERLIWVRSSTLYHSLSIKLRQGGGYMVGVREGAREDNGTPTSLVAKVLEYGSEALNIPARPLFKPTRDEVVNSLKPDYVDEIDKQIKRSMK